ncbi:KH domain-containing protein [Campylobacter sp. TTU_617]|uniref:KH domain-containing protein n=1 Tax=Campylobacter sp. TTU_617 TaxID=2768148 RepID=UPI001907532F|nr:KH domain-containing protein [Campylobacter sp. TTU_617]MBK1972386.1 KH domain-containing protein [Campylobacter sp. TTU_617]
MVEDFLREYAKLIVEFPDKIQVQKVDLEDNIIELVVFADKIDTGKLIGRNGKMINAIKTVVSAYKVKDLTSYRVTVKSIE